VRANSWQNKSGNKIIGASSSLQSFYKSLVCKSLHIFYVWALDLSTQSARLFSTGEIRRG